MTCLLLSATIHEFYATNLRGSLFSGFLTLAGFLFSAHTFIVMHMKKEIYDHEEYKNRIDSKRKENPNYSYYGGLQRLSILLICSVAATMLTALLQLTLGLIPYDWTAIVCLGASVLSLSVLSFSIYVMSANLRQWFVDLEAQSIKNSRLPKNITAPNT